MRGQTQSITVKSKIPGVAPYEIVPATGARDPSQPGSTAGQRVWHVHLLGRAMAVYTEVGFDEADALFQRLGLGALTELHGIRSGIENTNYYASTARGQWVLTLFERLHARSSCPTTCS